MLQAGYPSCHQPAVLKHWRKHKALTQAGGLALFFLRLLLDSGGRGVVPFTPALWVMPVPTWDVWFCWSLQWCGQSLVSDRHLLTLGCHHFLRSVFQPLCPLSMLLLLSRTWRGACYVLHGCVTERDSGSTAKETRLQDQMSCKGQWLAALFAYVSALCWFFVYSSGQVSVIWKLTLGIWNFYTWMPSP